jgi:hypothetical protein
VEHHQVADRLASGDVGAAGKDHEGLAGLYLAEAEADNAH